MTASPDELFHDDVDRPTMTVADIADAELLRRAVRQARSQRSGRYKHRRWVAVMECFCLGSTYAHQLCRRFGLDPDEEVKRDL